MSHRPAWVEIDTHALTYNLQQVRALIGPKPEIMAVVKADGYGHDAVVVGQLALKAGAKWLAVSMLNEALVLRNNGLTCPILILGWTPKEDYQTCLAQDICLSLFAWEEALVLSQMAQMMQKKAKIHIKVDTGMSRLGIMPNQDGLELVKKILDLPGIEVEGIFSHLSKADEADKTFAHQQLSIFGRFIHMLEESTDYVVPYKHIANSAAIIDLPKSHYDLVRPGIMLYGSLPSSMLKNQSVSLKPALTWKAKIARVQELPPETLVGYGGTYRASSTIKVATIPVGYADGYNRLLSNRGFVLCQGKALPVVGRICMDQFMVDATDLPQVKAGDIVTLLGSDGGLTLSAEDMANLLGTIAYEVYTRIAHRVPRVFV